MSLLSKQFNAYSQYLEDKHLEMFIVSVLRYLNATDED